MRQYEPHEVIELGLFNDFHRNLAAGIRAADHSGCSRTLYRKIAGFVLPGHLLPVDIIKPVAFDDLRDDFARLEELEFSTCKRAQA
ncbi:hypothetical protein ABN122_06960 [Enterobacter cloacae]|uniref:hypothetical protein n=1 Tax=Enterobacter cloacae TaxID=550 RepID=UPI0032DAB4D5